MNDVQKVRESLLHLILDNEYIMQCIELMSRNIGVLGLLCRYFVVFFICSAVPECLYAKQGVWDNISLHYSLDSSANLKDTDNIDVKSDTRENLDVIDQDQIDSENLYKNALRALKKRDFKNAIKSLLDLERLYPTSNLSIKSAIVRAYAQYKHYEYDAAISTIYYILAKDPLNKNMNYLLYLKARCFYDKMPDYEYFQGNKEEILNALSRVIELFPHSIYAKDALIKVEYVIDSFAHYEMNVGYFYLMENQLISALGRYHFVYDQYPNSIFVAEAIYRLCEIYNVLGLRAPLIYYSNILKKQHPDSLWTKRVEDILMTTSAISTK